MSDKADRTQDWAAAFWSKAFGWETVPVTMKSGQWAMGVGSAQTADSGMGVRKGCDALQRAEAEIDRLKAENAALYRRINHMERTLRPVRFNPSTGRDEILDPVAAHDEALAQVPREDRFRMFTLPGAVAEMADCIKGLRALVAEKDRLLHEARAGVASLNVENLHIDPESVIILRAYRMSPAEACERAKEVRDAIRRQTGHAVLVIVAQHDDSITLGRRPIGMPEYVREAYAEAAAASYGVTPDVVQRKKAERRARAVEAPLCQAKPEAAPPESRPPFGSKAIGTNLVPYPEPAL